MPAGIVDGDGVGSAVVDAVGDVAGTALSAQAAARTNSAKTVGKIFTGSAGFEPGGGSLVHEPHHVAGSLRHDRRRQFVPTENSGENVGLGLAGHEEDRMPATTEEWNCRGQPPAPPGNMVGHVVGVRFGECRGPREQRSRVAVVAHTEHDDIRVIAQDPLESPCVFFSGGVRRTTLLPPDAVEDGRYVIEQFLACHSLVRLFVIRGYPALVAEPQIDARPIDLRSAQLPVSRARRRAAGEAQRDSRTGRLQDQPGYVSGSRSSELAGICSDYNTHAGTLTPFSGEDPTRYGVIPARRLQPVAYSRPMAHVDPILEELTGPGQLFEIEEAVVHGHSMRVYKNRPRNLRDLLAIGMSHGDIEYLVQGDVRYTFPQAIARALSVAGALHDRFDVEPGDRVAVVGANAPDWVVAYWAVIAAQGIVVPFNAWWKAAELQFGIEDSGTSLVLCDARRAVTVVEAGFPADRIVVWGRGERPKGTTSIEELAAGEPAALDFAEARGEDEVAGLFYTSGTTGKPKGSANTHHNIITNLMNFGVLNRAQAIAAGEPPSGEKASYLCIIPLFHATANFTYMVPFMFAGHKLVFLPPGKFEADPAAQVIESERVTAIGGVPTIMARLIDAGVHERYDLTSVTAIGYGGAPASAALLAKINGAFPNLKKKVSTAYGLTETSAIATATGGLDYQEHPSSVGRASPVNDVKIAEFDGTPRPAGETGEIWLRGPNVVPGYWERPEANARSFVDGWFRSGDVGYIDEEGFVYITDRAKDMVIRGGENIYCVEVESALEAHPAVAEVAVIGVPHPELGEELKAVVVVAPGASTSESELQEFARERLADYKVPAFWEMRTEALPRNPAGKVLKAPLRGDHSGVFSVGDESDSAL